MANAMGSDMVDIPRKKNSAMRIKRTLEIVVR